MFAKLLAWITAGVVSGTPLLFGTSGEILTEKSGNLNLGVEGMMYMGGAFGLAGAFYYEQAAGENANGIVAVVIALLCAFLAGAFGALIFSFVTITLRANQNVTGLALTILGTGVGQFVGEYMRINVGGYVALSNEMKGVFSNSPWPAALRELPVVGPLLFNYNVFVYIGIVMAIAMAVWMKKTRAGMNLRAVGESPSTADAAGINVIRYRYLATTIGGGISAIGGMVYIMTTAGCVWNHTGLSGVGWLAVALVIFCLWKPANTLWGAALFGVLTIMYLWVSIPFIPRQLYKILPYVVAIVVLVLVSMRQKRENQPPAALGTNYFREER
jgi:simple sugar transport system permease protein